MNKARKRVVIQGIEGCFHHLAAQEYFQEEIEIVPAESFPKLTEIAKAPELCEYAIMAIENSIAGSILQNYGLLQESHLKVIGEIYINIEQSLLCLPGQTKEDIVEIRSHPMAIQQCRKFLKEHFPEAKLVETADTALSAKNVSDKQLKGVGVIAGLLAAELYKLEVLERGIESIHNNQTRFFILSRDTHDLVEFDKASIYFMANHEVGSLYKILEHISKAGVNLTKLQSFPSNSINWKYFFHADLVFEKQEQYFSVIKVLKNCTEELEVLGVYPKGVRIT